jgi:hypothetical protein
VLTSQPARWVVDREPIGRRGVRGPGSHLPALHAQRVRRLVLESAVTTSWLKRSELAYKNARLLSRPELNLHLEAITGSELVLVDTWGHIIWLGEAAEPGVSRRS